MWMAAVVAGEGHLDPGVGQRLGVRLALVTQRVELGGDHERRGEARQVLGTGVGLASGSAPSEGSVR